ncbi:MAG: M36 family metallopeptidase [Bryobacterales bacterium]|nr:M36 family metallopeptidase [Bryobacterales bacterium]
MRTQLLLLPVLTLLPAALAQQPDAPVHLFRARGDAALTEASAAPAREIGGRFLAAAAAGELKLSPAAAAGAELVKQYQSTHNGVTHLVYRQRFHDADVVNGEWTVNVDREGRVINSGGRLFESPAPGAALPSPFSVTRAAKAAAEAVNAGLGARYQADLVRAESLVDAAGQARTVQHLAAGAFGADLEGRAVWYGVGRDVVPAWEFYVLDEDRIHAYNVVVDGATRQILEKESLTFEQSPGGGAPRGLVFERHSPRPNLRPGFRGDGAVRPLVERTLQPLTGDPASSPRGWVAGDETAGNNVVAGANPLGNILDRPRTARSASRDFQFPLEIGPSAPNPTSFADAASVNLFYWMNRSHDLFYEAGFDEAAGNYQQDNFGRGGVASDPILAFSGYGAAAPFGLLANNAFYTTRRSGEDGSPSNVSMFIGVANNTGFSDGSYDAEVMVHEYTHAVSTRLVRRLSGHHGGAMGEAWSDFYSLEFTVPDGAPPDGVYPVGEFLFQNYNGGGLRTRPYSTDKSINNITFAEIGRVNVGPAIHDDGMIWVESLWEARANLIAQLGEREGRRRIRRLVLDGMKLSPPAPTMVDMRDAILLADRVGFQGASQEQLWRAFASRGLGALAHAASTNSTHVASSFDMPAPLGALRFYEPSYVNGETVRVVLQDANNTSETANVQLTSSSGDLENMLLQRQGSVYYGTMATFAGAVTKNSGALTSAVGDQISAYYLDRNTGGIAAREINATVPTRPAYTIATSAPAPYQFAGETRAGFRAPFQSFFRLTLPWAFPFFGKPQRSVAVYSNGLLAFETPPSTQCTDAATLARYNAIAPMWMELATDGAAAEDVYLSRPTADSVTIRWVAGTENGFVAPEPVNFAVTLYEDGRIEFRYGPGNKNLAVNNPVAGCASSTPTVGISNGNETFTQMVLTHYSTGNLENAPTVTLFPGEGFSSLPQVTLTRPSEAAATFRDVMNGRAIVRDSASFVTRVDVYIDGVYRANAVRQAARPAECGPASAGGGDCAEFLFNVNLAGLGIEPGRHDLKLRAINWRGGFNDDAPVAFTVEAGQGLPVVGVLETPANGADITGVVRLRGYAYSQSVRVTGVELLVDGLSLARFSLLLPRPDICGALNPAPVNCPAVGFDIGLNTGDIFLAPGVRKIQMRAVDETGRFTLFPETPVEINVRTPPATANVLPRGVLVTPSHNDKLTGMVNIWGYGWDPDGRVVAAQLVINGQTRATIPYGEPRPGECPSLGEVPACPNIGFALDFDTRLLNNGPNVLGVRLIDNQGGSVLLPAPVSPNRNGITVVVEN